MPFKPLGTTSGFKPLETPTTTSSGFKPLSTATPQPVVGTPQIPRPEERFGVKTTVPTEAEAYQGLTPFQRYMTKWSSVPGPANVYFPLYQASHLAGNLANTVEGLQDLTKNIPLTPAWVTKKATEQAKARGANVPELKPLKEYIPFFKSTEKVREARMKLGERDIAKKGFSLTPAVETVNALLPLLEEFALTKGIGMPGKLKKAEQAWQMTKVAKAGAFKPIARILSPANLDNVARSGIVGYLATEGAPQERINASKTLMAYSIVPMATGAIGLKGTKGFLGALLGNLMVSKPFYTELAESYGGWDKAIKTKGFYSHVVPQAMLDLFFSSHAKGSPEIGWKNFKEKKEVPEAEFAEMVKGSPNRYAGGKLFKMQTYGGEMKEVEVIPGTSFDIGDHTWWYWGKKGDKVRLVDVNAEVENGTLKVADTVKEEIMKMGKPVEWNKAFTAADQQRLKESLNMKQEEYDALTKDLSPDVEFGQLPYVVKERLIPELRKAKDLPPEARKEFVNTYLNEIEGNAIYRLHGLPDANSAVVFYRGQPFEAFNLGIMLALEEGKTSAGEFQFKNGWDDSPVPDLQRTIQRGMDEAQRQSEQLWSREKELFKRTVKHDTWKEPLFDSVNTSVVRSTSRTGFEIRDLGSDFVPGEWDVVSKSENVEFRMVKNLTEEKVNKLLEEKGLKVDKSKGFGFYGAVSFKEGPNKLVVLMDPKYVDKLHEIYAKGGRTFGREVLKKGLIPIHKVAQGMNKQQWRQFVIQHELIHHTAGLDGGIADENMINAAAFIRIGMPEAADLIRQESVKNTRIKEFFKPSETEAFGGKKTREELEESNRTYLKNAWGFPDKTIDLFLSGRTIDAMESLKGHPYEELLTGFIKKYNNLHWTGKIDFEAFGGLKDKYDKLFGHMARLKGIARSHESQVRDYFNVLYEAADSPELLQSGKEHQKLVRSYVQAAERAYFKGDMAKAIEYSETALQYIHERTLIPTLDGYLYDLEALGGKKEEKKLPGEIVPPRATVAQKQAIPEPPALIHVVGRNFDFKEDVTIAGKKYGRGTIDRMAPDRKKYIIRVSDGRETKWGYVDPSNVKWDVAPNVPKERQEVVKSIDIEGNIHQKPLTITTYRPKLASLFKAKEMTTDPAEKARLDSLINAEMAKPKGVEKMKYLYKKQKGIEPTRPAEEPRHVPTAYIDASMVSHALEKDLAKAEREIFKLKEKADRLFVRGGLLDRDLKLGIEADRSNAESTLRTMANGDIVDMLGNEIHADFTNKTSGVPEELKLKLKTEMEKMPAEEQGVLNMYFGLDRLKPLSLEEIGVLWKKPLDQVNQLYDKAIGHLRGKFKTPKDLIQMHIAEGAWRDTSFGFDESEGGIHFLSPERAKQAEDIKAYQDDLNFLLKIEALENTYLKRADGLLKKAAPADRPGLSKNLDVLKKQFKDSKNTLRNKIMSGYPKEVVELVERKSEDARKRREAREDMNSVEEGKDYQDSDTQYLGGAKDKKGGSISKETENWDNQLFGFRMFQHLEPFLSQFPGLHTEGWYTIEGDRKKWVDRHTEMAKARHAVNLSPVREKVIPVIAKEGFELSDAEVQGNIFQDLVLHQVRKVVETDPYLRKKWDIQGISEDAKWNEKLKVQEMVLETLSRVDEELLVNLDDMMAGKLTVALSEQGRGIKFVDDLKSQFFDPSTGLRVDGTTNAFMERYPGFYKWWNDGKDTTVTRRPEAAYYSLLKNHPELQKLSVWAKHKQTQRALELKQSNVFDYMDIMTSMAKGYAHKAWMFKPGNKPASTGGGRVLNKDEEFELHSKSADFDDFVARCNDKGLDAVGRFDISASKYQTEALGKVSFNKMIRQLLDIPHPEDPNFSTVMYVGKWYKDGKIVAPKTKDAIELTYDMLSKLHMVEMKNAPDLVARKGDLWSPPYVHKSFESTIDGLYGNKISDMNKAFLKLVGWNKRFIMYTPTIFSFQAASSLVVNMPMHKIPGAIGKSLFAVLPLPYFRSAESMKGMVGKAGMAWNKLAENTLVGAGMKAHWTIGQGMDTLIGNLAGFKKLTPEKLQRSTRSGLKAFRSIPAFDSWFNSGMEKEHPSMRTKAQNAVEFWINKCGLDKWSFERYLTGFSLDAWEAASNRFQKKYKITQEEADILAAHWVNDMIGSYDRGVYGSEGPMLQWLMFARDFTVSEFRNLTGAYHFGRKMLGPFKKLLPYDFHHRMAYKGEWGNVPFVSWLLNPLWHKELSSGQMEMLGASYASQAAKAIVWKLMLINMVQMALGQGSSINNEEDKKFMAKTNMVDESGRPVYLDFLYFREANQYVSMLPRAGGIGAWSSGLGKELTQKLGVVPRLLTGIISGYDAMGNPITGGEEIPFQQRMADKAVWIWNQINPAPLQMGQKQDLTRDIIQTVTPMRFSYGRASGNVTPEEMKQYRQIIAREKFRQDQVIKLVRQYDLDHPIWQVALDDNILTYEQFSNLRKKQMVPEYFLRKPTKNLGRKQEYSPPPWLQ